MANRNTKRNRSQQGYGQRKTGCCVNSSEGRLNSHKARYRAPTITDRQGTPVHPVSGLTNRQMARMQT